MADIPDLESKLARLREAAAQRFPALVELNERMFADLDDDHDRMRIGLTREQWSGRGRALPDDDGG